MSSIDNNDNDNHVQQVKKKKRKYDEDVILTELVSDYYSRQHQHQQSLSSTTAIQLQSQLLSEKSSRFNKLLIGVGGGGEEKGKDVDNLSKLLLRQMDEIKEHLVSEVKNIKLILAIRKLADDKNTLNWIPRWKNALTRWLSDIMLLSTCSIDSRDDGNNTIFLKMSSNDNQQIFVRIDFFESWDCSLATYLYENNGSDDYDENYESSNASNDINSQKQRAAKENKILPIKLSWSVKLMKFNNSTSSTSSTDQDAVEVATIDNRQTSVEIVENLVTFYEEFTQVWASMPFNLWVKIFRQILQILNVQLPISLQCSSFENLENYFFLPLSSSSSSSSSQQQQQLKLHPGILDIADVFDPHNNGDSDDDKNGGCNNISGGERGCNPLPGVWLNMKWPTLIIDNGQRKRAMIYQNLLAAIVKNTCTQLLIKCAHQQPAVMREWKSINPTQLLFKLCDITKPVTKSSVCPDGTVKCGTRMLWYSPYNPQTYQLYRSKVIERCCNNDDDDDDNDSSCVAKDFLAYSFSCRNYDSGALYQDSTISICDTTSYRDEIKRYTKNGKSDKSNTYEWCGYSDLMSNDRLDILNSIDDVGLHWMVEHLSEQKFLHFFKWLQLCADEILLHFKISSPKFFSQSTSVLALSNIWLTDPAKLEKITTLGKTGLFVDELRRSLSPSSSSARSSSHSTSANLNVPTELVNLVIDYCRVKSPKDSHFIDYHRQLDTNNANHLFY